MRGVTALDAQQIAALPRNAEGDQRLAQAIRAAAPMTAPLDGLLATAFEQETVPTTETVNVGTPWRWLMVQRTERDWELPGGRWLPASYEPRGWQCVWQRGWIAVVPGASEATRSAAVIWVYLPGVTTTLFALWLVWVVARLPQWLWRGRRIRRRTARGECLACGYDLKVPASAREP